MLAYFRENLATWEEAMLSRTVPLGMFVELHVVSIVRGMEFLFDTARLQMLVKLYRNACNSVAFFSDFFWCVAQQLD